MQGQGQLVEPVYLSQTRESPSPDVRTELREKLVTRVEREQETYVAQIDFTMRDHVPNEFVRVNPLGMQNTYYRTDQAFEEARQ